MEIKGTKYSLLYYKKQKDYENYCYAYFFNAVNEKVLDGEVLIEYLEKQNTPKSLGWLAWCYWFGFGVVGDLQLFQDLLTESHKRGNPDASIELADLYVSRLKTDEKIAEAIKLYKRGVKQNNAIALAYYGAYYHDKIGSHRAIRKGLKYLKRSAKQGFEFAQCKLGTYYKKRNKMGKALHYLRLGAKNGSSDGLRVLGDIYSDAKYNRVDIKKAIQYYSKCNGSSAYYRLGYIYENDLDDCKNAVVNYRQCSKRYNDLCSWLQTSHGEFAIMSSIHRCEMKLIKLYATSVDIADYVEAYELMLKHGENPTQIIKLLKPEYLKCLDSFGKDISSIILPFLIENVWTQIKS